MGMKFSQGKPKPLFQLMTSVIFIAGASAFLRFKEDFYVNITCTCFSCWFKYGGNMPENQAAAYNRYAFDSLHILR